MAVMLTSAIIPGGFKELCKLPSLVGHYTEHKLESKNLSFTDFILMHYNETSNHRNEENHEDLPLFHTCCGSVVLFVTENVFQNVTWITEPQQMPVTFIPNHYNYNFHHTIFQPPRLG